MESGCHLLLLLFVLAFAKKRQNIKSKNNATQKMWLWLPLLAQAPFGVRLMSNGFSVASVQ